MNKIRLFLFICGSLLAPLLHAGEKRPNILFIAIDDMNDWTGFLGGHDQAVTPNLDAVANKGVNFTNAHCPAPGCSPSRNALLYGIEPFNSGLYPFYDKAEFHETLRGNYVSLPQFLKENGYGTYGAGKIHHGSRAAESEWTDYHKPERHALKLDLEAGYQMGGKRKMSFCPTTNPFEEHPDHKVASYGIDVLSKDHEKPFFLAVGIVRPHLPFICPPEFFDLYPDPVDPPRIKEDDLNDIPWVGRSMARRGDDNRFRKDEAWDKVRRAYLACISWADYNIGRVLDALEASPYADNTIVVIWSDHGYALGEKHHFRKFALWEETTRVPFIIWDTRESDHVEGRTVEGGVSLINIYQTLAEMTGLKAPGYVDGYSLVPQLQDPSVPLPEPSICTWGRGNYTIRDKDFRYTRYFNGGEEFYAHEVDPDEWTNLADDPAYADEKARLAAYLPKDEAPLVKEGIAPWSIPPSADKPEQKK
ncbi:MAG: sulfatase [Puniceicoccaceae bacterium]